MAGGADVGEVAADLAAFEGEVVATGFSGDAEFGAGVAPVAPVGRNFAASGAVGGHEVGQFVAQGAVDLLRRNADELGVEFDESPGAVGATGGGAEPGVPVHEDAFGEVRDAEGGDEAPAQVGQVGIVSRGQGRRGGGSGEAGFRRGRKEFELLAGEGEVSAHGMMAGRASGGWISSSSPVSLLRNRWEAPSVVTRVAGGTLSRRKTLAPMVEPMPMTVLPPRMVALG